MDFRDTPEEAAFRTAVREFIGQNLPEPLRERGTSLDEGSQNSALKEWRAALGRQGWIAPHWPKEFGGGGMSVSEQFVYNEEMAESRAPDVGGMGVQMIGPVLIRFGTPEQQKEHLSGITSGEEIWCQGYSEPGSGSDLASLQTRAVRDGDDFIINGQKIWTSGAHRATRMFMLARTEPDAPKHRGISMFLLDMKSPGITVRPLITLTGDHVFNEVFFDNVRVPARNMIGEENRGWYVGAALLDFERSGIVRSIALKHMVTDLTEWLQADGARRASLSAGARTELAARAIEAEVARLISYRVITIQKSGGVPNYEASMNKLFRSEVHQRIAETGWKLSGTHGVFSRGTPQAPLEGQLSHNYLASMSATIAGGTSEINRNVIATRGLGLPRS